jgi:hydrogenase expression/formation protein HypE
VLNKSEIPLSNLTKKICNVLEVDPYRLISSGSMLIVTPNGSELQHALQQGGVNATFVGKVIDKKGAYLDSEDTKQIFAMPDELYRKMGE